jgi:hypothetical protein
MSKSPAGPSQTRCAAGVSAGAVSPLSSNTAAYLSSPRRRSGELPIEQWAFHVVDVEALNVLCPFEPVPVGDLRCGFGGRTWQVAHLGHACIEGRDALWVWTGR